MKEQFDENDYSYVPNPEAQEMIALFLDRMAVVRLRMALEDDARRQGRVDLYNDDDDDVTNQLNNAQ